MIGPDDPSVQGSAVDAAPHSDEAEQALLRELNRRLPPGVDWKEGARTYLAELARDQGEHTELYHLVKPFLGGPDFSPFFTDMFHFLGVVQKLDLAMKSRVLDVGCGPGWTSHYLGKLGHTVLGIDIADNLLDVARRRVASDPYPPYPGRPFAVEFMNLDIESAAPPAAPDGLWDAAIFESTLHHFYNPIAAVRNVADVLAPGGVIAVLEGSAPPEGSFHDNENQDLINRYHTIERPYTRAQITEILRLGGFPHVAFYYPINGLFREGDEKQADLLRHLVLYGEGWNLAVGARRPEALARIEPDALAPATTSHDLSFGEGFYGEESAGGEYAFRWAAPRAVLRVNGPRRDLRLRVRFPMVSRRHLYQRVTARTAAGHRAAAWLTAVRRDGELVLPGVGEGDAVTLFADTAFCPEQWGAGDSRTLAFQVLL